MTQDCLDSHSTAGVSRRLPKGINITGTGGKPAPAIEGIPWGYLFIHNKTAQVFEREMDSYNENNPQSAHACFIHRSFTYRQKNENGGVKKELKPTISGLVFLQGRTVDLQKFLRARYPQYHLSLIHISEPTRRS